MSKQVEFEITAVFKARPDTYIDAASCLESLGTVADRIMKPYGGRIINVSAQRRETDGEPQTDRIVLVMKASGVTEAQ